MRILVVDDSKMMRMVIRQHLERYGLTNIVEACDGQEALGKMGEERIDLVLTDWEMPKLNGLAFLKKLREHPDYEVVRVIFITANGHRDLVAAAVDGGANDFIVKPFGPETLRSKIERLMGVKLELA